MGCRVVVHYGDIMDTVASQITSLTIVYSTVWSDADQRKHQSSASLAFEWEIHRWPVNSPHKWLVTRKMFPFDDVIMHLVRIDLQIHRKVTRIFEIKAFCLRSKCFMRNWKMSPEIRMIILANTISNAKHTIWLETVKTTSMKYGNKK